jgi:phosphate-selective porin
MKKLLIVSLLLTMFGMIVKAEVKVSGFVQVQLVNDESLVGKELYATCKRARIIAKGDMGDKVELFAQLETLTKEVNLLDLVVEYNLGTFGKIGLGRFCIPVGLQNSVSPYNLHTINYAQVVQKLVGSGARDFGIRWTGKYSVIDWNLACINGADGSTTVSNDKEDNDVKDIALRVGVSIPMISGLGIGVSAYDGKAGATKTEKKRLGADLKYEKDPVYLQGEYISGKDGETEKSGMYVELGYKIGGLQPIARYEVYDGDTKVEDSTEITITAIGINYYIGKNSKIQLIYEMKKDKLGASLSDIKNDVMIAQVAAKF